MGFRVIVLGSEMGQCLCSVVRKVSRGRWALSRKEAGAPSWVNQGDTCQDTERGLTSAIGPQRLWRPTGRCSSSNEQANKEVCRGPSRAPHVR